MQRKKKRLYQDQTGIWCQPIRRKKNKDYYTEDDYIQAEYLIYNNLPFYSSTERPSPTVAQESLLEGEHYTLIPGISERYVITNKYRVVCVKTSRTVKPFMSYKYHYVIVENKQVNLRKVYEENNWEYNYEEVVSLYDQERWAYLDYRVKHAPRGERVLITNEEG